MRTPTSDIPNSWEMAQLGNVCSKPQYGWTTKAVRTGDNLKLLRTSDISSGRVNWETVPTCVSEPEEPSKYFLSQGDIVVARAGSVGKSFLIREDVRDAVFASYLVRFTPKISPALINLFMQSRRYWSQIEDQSSGIAIPNVNASKLAKLELPIPPLNEQQRIVEKIETLFAQLDKGEEAIRQVQNLLKTYRQSVLKAAVTGELTRDWREANKDKLEPASDLLDSILKTRRENWQGRGKYKEPQAPDTSDLPELPEGWVLASMDQLTVHLTSGSRDWKQYYGRGEGIFIMAQNVRPMRFDLSEKFLVDPPLNGSDATRSQVRKDDLLITIVGANTGDICRFPTNDKQYYVCQSVALLRLGDVCLSPFVEVFLSGKGAGRDQLDKFIYGAGRPHLSFEQLRTVNIPLPSVDEQSAIMSLVEECFAKIEKIEMACEAELSRSASLRQSILKQAFSGKLVPQDPDDEPASVLLERINAEREANTPSRKKTSKKPVKKKVRHERH